LLAICKQNHLKITKIFNQRVNKFKDSKLLFTQNLIVSVKRAIISILIKTKDSSFMPVKQTATIVESIKIINDKKLFINFLKRISII
jgi:hypothetical protein